MDIHLEFNLMFKQFGFSLAGVIPNDPSVAPPFVDPRES